MTKGMIIVEAGAFSDADITRIEAALPYLVIPIKPGRKANVVVYSDSWEEVKKESK